MGDNKCQDVGTEQGLEGQRLGHSLKWESG